MRELPQTCEYSFFGDGRCRYSALIPAENIYDEGATG